MPGTLARTLGLRDLILIVVGTVIGSGIFTVPGAVLRQTEGDVGVALLVWLLGGALSLVGALAYGELGAMLPEAGGGYVYIREAFGRLPAFLLGWTLFLVIGTGSMATLAVAFSNYLGQFVALGPGQTNVAANAGEAIDPQRTFPRGIVAGTVILIGIYLFANVGYLAALGPAGVAGTDRVAAAAVSALFGPGVARLVAAAILVSMFSATNGLILTTSRVYYAMARDGLFFRRLAEVHPRFGTPAFAIVAGSVWAMLLAVTGTFEELFTYVIFAAWIFYALGVASVLVLRRRRPEAPRPFRVPGYPVTPWLFILAAAAIVGSTIWARPVRSGIGLGIIVLGLPAYVWWKRRSVPGGHAVFPRV